MPLAVLGSALSTASYTSYISEDSE
jgi:hypothetical protein